MLSALCGALTVVYGSLLRFLATCGCLQGRTIFQTNCFGARIKAFTEYCGGSILSFFVVLSVLLLLASLVLCYVTFSTFAVMVVLLEAKVWSQVEWFFWAAPFFSFRYPIDRRYFYRQLMTQDAELSKV
jgi:hypothetical protein